MHAPRQVLMHVCMYHCMFECMYKCTFCTRTPARTQCCPGGRLESFIDSLHLKHEPLFVIISPRAHLSCTTRDWSPQARICDSREPHLCLTALCQTMIQNTSRWVPPSSLATTVQHSFLQFCDVRVTTNAFLDNRQTSHADCQ
jgi:hypothetical protein